MLRASAGMSAAALLLCGCGSASVATSGTRHDTVHLDLGKAETARVEIHMDAGELRVKSGTPKLLDADFVYNLPEWKPLVDYRDAPAAGVLTISQPGSASHLFGRTEYTWDLNMNSQRPTDFSTHMGAGKADLVLGQMNLRSVEIHVGAGELKLDLRGEPRRDYSVQVHGGVGEATVYLPKDTGISATAAGGIGEISATGLEKREGVWINPERLNAPVTVHLDVKGGVGQIRLVR